MNSQAKKAARWNFSRTWPLHLLLLPALLLVILFNYLPMGGLVIAFQDYKPWTGFANSPWVGWDNFRLLLDRPDSIQVIRNTAVIAIAKLLFSLVASVLFALLLNEVRQRFFKKAVQTIVYLPHFISWVVLSGVLIDVLAVKGIVNGLLQDLFGIEPVLFLANGDWFRITIVVSDIWKEFGFGTIVFLAALAGINPSLYEAAEMDGASRLKMTLHITLPGILPMIIVVFTLSLGNVLNAGFDQIYNLITPLVYGKGDIIDTFVYRTGILSGQMSFATAVGLFKSVIGFVLIVVSYRLAYKFARYTIF
ncbi:ABC transporter permease [Cohnella phaseoli]|uniref:Putative aldouronate transport system permease protein n=1 Tax=Cohnella phaseoli TaxID=456490 RepID=A0A3D9KLY4_9BACL|nr:ABC transporter permease subunit [Cohnella phaseoli]RED87582.1 putative aldouronate transport system permease protein [Cohnella phaseoli]